MYDEKVAKQHMERMREPEHLRRLRDQIEELDRKDRKAEYELQAEALRQEIRRRGQKPCA